MSKPKRVSNYDARPLISRREPFTNHNGSFRGVRGYEGRGHLPTQFVTDSLLKAEYVVYSYRTPLAWVRRGRWYYASVSYSPTTTQHQSIVRWAMTGKPAYLGGDWRKVPGSGRYWDGSPKIAASTGMPAGYYGVG